MIPQAKFHVVSSLITGLKIDILMLLLICASFVIIMLLREGLTHTFTKKSLGCILVRVSL